MGTHLDNMAHFFKPGHNAALRIGGPFSLLCRLGASPATISLALADHPCASRHRETGKDSGPRTGPIGQAGKVSKFALALSGRHPYDLVKRQAEQLVAVGKA